MSKYIDLAPEFAEEHNIDEGVAGYVLRCLDEYAANHPDKAPGLTITETELRRQIDKHLPDGTTFEQVSMFMIDIDHPVVPDPEPTPRQRLEALIFEKWGDADDAQMITMSILDEFDVSVKAPEIDDE